MTERRFPPAWSIDDADMKLGQDCCAVRNAHGQALGALAFSRACAQFWAYGNSTERKQKRDCAMMPKQQARAAVEAELFALKLKKPLSLPEKYAFSESACHRLVFQSETDRLREIIEWTDAWQALWLADDRTHSMGAAEAAVGELGFALPRLDWAMLASRIAAWRANVGRVFAKHRSTQNEKQFGDKGVLTPQAASTR